MCVTSFRVVHLSVQILSATGFGTYIVCNTSEQSTFRFSASKDCVADILFFNHTANTTRCPESTSRLTARTPASENSNLSRCRGRSSHPASFPWTPHSHTTFWVNCSTVHTEVLEQRLTPYTILVHCLHVSQNILFPRTSTMNSQLLHSFPYTICNELIRNWNFG